MSRNFYRITGLAVVAAGGYYLYQSSGQPKQAVRIAEHDANVGYAKVKSEFKSDRDSAMEKGREYGEKAGAKLDRASAEAKSTYDDARKSAEKTWDQGKQAVDDTSKTLEQKRKEAGKNINESIDRADRRVEADAAKAKSNVSSWFGSSK